MPREEWTSSSDSSDSSSTSSISDDESSRRDSDLSDECSSSHSYSDSDISSDGHDSDWGVHVVVRPRDSTQPLEMQLRASVVATGTIQPVHRVQMGVLLREAAADGPADEKNEAINALLSTLPRKNPSWANGTSCFTCNEQAACVRVTPCNHVTACVKCMRRSARVFKDATRHLVEARPTCFVCRVPMQMLTLVDVQPDRICQGVGCKSTALVLCEPCNHAYGCQSCVQMESTSRPKKTRRKVADDGPDGPRVLRCLKPGCTATQMQTTPLIFA